MDSRGEDGSTVMVPVSAVVTAAFCPMRLYLERRTGTPRGPGPRYVLCRQVASHLGRELDPERIWDEALAIDPGIDPSLREFLGECIERCARGGPWPLPRESDLPLASRRFGLVGNVDKVFDAVPHFAVVRAVHAPPSGTHASDRLRVFGYMLLLSDAAGRDVPHGSIEYIPSGVSRSCTPNPVDKRRFLRALESAREVISGKVPARVTGPRCRSCPFHAECLPMGRRLSDILG
ncbi:MAG: Dna2/Cas4 domain-containing protein [Methanolinea sp.]|nr:Dna2/Cas4 domain-containing protein [Methanolinea sp.]